LSETQAAVAHQFDDLEQQREASELGMWTFLATEVLFFGGLFLGYTLYRLAYPGGFAEGSRHLSLLWGTVNTAVLILSSLTMALAVEGARARSKRAVIGFLLATFALASVFLAIKGVEYSHHIREHLVPTKSFTYEGPHAARRSELAGGGERGSEERARTDGRELRLFLSFYFAMTGTHAVHMILGMVVLLVLTVLVWRDRIRPPNTNPIEMVGLYWHFVDVVWIFLFPLLYLLGRHS
jgi:cytochrome c oxidase subunit 3